MGKDDDDLYDELYGDDDDEAMPIPAAPPPKPAGFKIPKAVPATVEVPPPPPPPPRRPERRRRQRRRLRHRPERAGRRRPRRSRRLQDRARRHRTAVRHGTHRRAVRRGRFRPHGRRRGPRRHGRHARRRLGRPDGPTSRRASAERHPLPKQDLRSRRRPSGSTAAPAPPPGMPANLAAARAGTAPSRAPAGSSEFRAPVGSRATRRWRAAPVDRPRPRPLPARRACPSTEARP